jgi:hemolysin III
LARERAADRIVHVISIGFAIAASLSLIVIAFLETGALRRFGLVVYATGLVLVFVCSALYNLAWQHSWTELFRRLDHAAIFVMIAGTYTPLTLISMSGTAGFGLFSLVWSVAIAGIVAKLFFPSRFERLSLAAYLLLGWVIVLAIGPLTRALPLPGIILIGIGGMFYSFGVIFHVWRRLPFQNAVWHLFVLAGAATQYAAILGYVARS